MSPSTTDGRKPGTLSKILLAILLLTLVACATPVGVNKVSHEKAYQTLTASVLSGDELSEPTIQVLNRTGLSDFYRDDPAAVIADLHQRISPLHHKGLLFALAEMSFQQGEHSGEGAYFLSAAAYAYAFLFPGQHSDAPDPFDPRLRIAVELYNQGILRGFTDLSSKTVNLKSGRYRLPFGWLKVTVDPEEFFYGPYRMTDFADASQLIPRGLHNRYRWPGIGGPLVATLQETKRVPETEYSRLPQGLRVPVTAVLDLGNVEEGFRTGQLSGELSLYTTQEATTVAISGRRVALEYATTAALGVTLEGSRLYFLEYTGLFSGEFKTIRETTRKDDNIFFMAPYQPGKIPVVFVHGTASSPARWAEMLNELTNDRELWGHYQFWLFIYNTGNPILYSSGILTDALRRTVQEFDPAGTDPAMKRMVVIGHSQGGLLTKLTAVDSGTRFWDNAFRVPIDQVEASPETLALLRRSLFYTPLPFVERVIFISTPHRGSYLAGGRLGHVLSSVITLPLRLISPLTDLFKRQPEIMSLGSIDEIPRSTDNMDPKNRFILTLSDIPMAPGIKAHSIIAVDNLEDPEEDWNDGVVDYQSAHIEGATSELIVASGHSAQENPLAIEEVRRILREHLRDR